VTEPYPEPILRFLGGEPTAEQWRAISSPLEPCVVVAGAGSGKTSVMAARVVYLAMVATGRLEADHPGVMPGNVLCLTFTNKATENLILKIRRALRTLELEEGEEPEISNYHAFAAQVLERHGMLIGLEPGQRVLSQAQRTQIAARVLDRMTFEQQHTRWQPTIVGYITDLDEQLQNHLVEPEEVIEHVEGKLEVLRKARAADPLTAAKERIEIARAVRVFRDIKAELGVIDFGDQIAHAVRIASAHPEVGESYRGRFGAVLLDEYQDTNHAQAVLMRAVFGAGHPVTAVGDPDQNIYAWRGASLWNLLRFRAEFPRADGSEAEQLPLYTNFRSGARILQAADRVIDALPPNQRPDPDKLLRPWERNGQGHVEVAQYEHEVAEADGVAERALKLHAEGIAWKDMAVLCRTHRLFEALQLAFGTDVPAEFVNLAGLIHLPEVVEVLAYARAADDPRDGVALARILTGPRYRVGLRDLAAVAGWSRRSGFAFMDLVADLALDEDEDLLEDHPFLLAEALEHLDEIEELSGDGRTRLAEFRDELDGLRVAARRPVGEFLAEIIRRTGLLAELDAAPDQSMASARRRNLAAFLEQVHGFQPVEGELTLRAFLGYVDTIEDDREWNPVQPSDDDSVKVMTVHAAKGLEFEVVFVPGLASGLFPDARVQQNPARKGSSLDVELRRDRELLPRFDDNMKAFTDALREQEVAEERRTCYVALTRAKQHLFVSSANWYGENLMAKGVGVFWIELKKWADGGGGDVWFAAGTQGGADVPEGDPRTNPLAGYRQRFVRPWPGPARPGDADPLFPQGWRRAALEASGSGGTGELVGALAADELAQLTEASAARRTLATHLRAQEATVDEGPALPATVSVGGLIDYGRCPKLHYWTSVRPLPRFAGPSARIGTEIHRWIEMKSRGQATLLEVDDEPDLTVEELAGTPGKKEDLRQRYLRSRFAEMVPLYAERPFLLPIEGITIRGRIDAIYGLPEGPWEVVDYKTGRPPADDDPLARTQLDLYALACIEVWHKAPEELKLTYLYLATGEERSHAVDDVSAVRERIRRWLRGIGAGAFEPTPGPQCRWCDFRPFCDAGKAWLDTNDGDRPTT
jgi:DNA helicase II / ATP-dependent DNA helicase PcrA